MEGGHCNVWPSFYLKSHKSLIVDKTNKKEYLILAEGLDPVLWPQRSAQKMSEPGLILIFKVIYKLNGRNVRPHNLSQSWRLAQICSFSDQSHISCPSRNTRPRNCLNLSLQRICNISSLLVDPRSFYPLMSFDPGWFDPMSVYYVGID